MRKFFNSAESNEIQRKQKNRRQNLKRRAARRKLEAQIHKHLKSNPPVSSILAEHLVSRIQFPASEEPIVHDIESLIEDSMKNQKGE